MKVSKKAQYGLRAMVYLAEHSLKEKVCSLKEISEKERIPFEFLGKIIPSLQEAGLVGAKKGAQGGYFLAKKAITAGEIVRALEATTAVNCKGCQMIKGCATKNVWGKVQEALDSALDSISLSDLARK